MFDEYLHYMKERDGTDFQPFNDKKEYRLYVDGKPRYEGVKSSRITERILP